MVKHHYYRQYYIFLFKLIKSGSKDLVEYLVVLDK